MTALATRPVLRRTKRRPREHRVLEHGIQCGVFAWRELAKAQQPVLALLYAVPNGAALAHTIKRSASGKLVRFSKEGHKLKREGLTAGIPDVCLPAARGPYHGLYIEHKTPTGGTSSEQKKIIAALRAEGYLVVISRDSTTSIALITAYLALGPFAAGSAPLSAPTSVQTRRRAQLPDWSP